jgi:hypothetical protein
MPGREATDRARTSRRGLAPVGWNSRNNALTMHGGQCPTADSGEVGDLHRQCRRSYRSHQRLPAGPLPSPPGPDSSLVTCTNGPSTASAVPWRPYPFQPVPRGLASGGAKVERTPARRPTNVWHLGSQQARAIFAARGGRPGHGRGITGRQRHRRGRRGAARAEDQQRWLSPASCPSDKEARPSAREGARRSGPREPHDRPGRNSGRLPWRRSTTSWQRSTTTSTSLACRLRRRPSSMPTSRRVMR